MKGFLIRRAAVIVFSFFVICLLAASVHSQTETQTAETQKATEPAGKTIFVDNKCSTCHSIQSVEITKKLSSSKAPDRLLLPTPVDFTANKTDKNPTNY